MALLSCENLSFGYEGHTIVENINFDVNHADYIFILGENGSGKSTLIKGLLGLKQPYGGNIVLGDNIKKNEIGYLSQQTVVQRDFPASVFEIVLSGRLNSKGKSIFYNKKDKEIAYSNMEILGIECLAKRCYRELSGGQQQRVLLARAFCSSKKLIVLDEPISGLDPMVTKDLYSILENVNKTINMAIIMVSHDIDGALKYAKNILSIKNRNAEFMSIHDYKSKLSNLGGVENV